VVEQRRTRCVDLVLAVAVVADPLLHHAAP
jgi:hypothetical protein